MHALKSTWSCILQVTEDMYSVLLKRAYMGCIKNVEHSLLGASSNSMVVMIHGNLPKRFTIL